MSAAVKTGTSPKDAVKFAKDQGVKIVDVKFVDLPGTWQHFSIPVEDFSEDIFAEGIGFDGSSIRGFQQIHKLGYDDTLDAFGIHGVGGTIGAVLTGVFADPSINELGKGLLFGNAGQIWTQIIASLITFVYSGVVTAIIFMIIKFTVGLRC